MMCEKTEKMLELMGKMLSVQETAWHRTKLMLAQLEREGKITRGWYEHNCGMQDVMLENIKKELKDSSLRLDPQ